MPQKRDPITLLQYEAKRQPELAAIIDRLPGMSEDDIKNCKVKLPWMRRALLELRQRKLHDAMNDTIITWAIDGRTPDPMGEIRRWTGDPVFVRVGRTEIEIKPGELLWFSADGVWIDSIHSRYVDPILAQCLPLGKMTRSEYLNAVRDRVRNMTVSPSVEVREPLAGVRFYRVE